MYESNMPQAARPEPKLLVEIAQKANEAENMAANVLALVVGLKTVLIGEEPSKPQSQDDTPSRGGALPGLLSSLHRTHGLHTITTNHLDDIHRALGGL